MKCEYYPALPSGVRLGSIVVYRRFKHKEGCSQQKVGMRLDSVPWTFFKWAQRIGYAALALVSAASIEREDMNVMPSPNTHLSLVSVFTGGSGRLSK